MQTSMVRFNEKHVRIDNKPKEHQEEAKAQPVKRYFQLENKLMMFGYQEKDAMEVLIEVGGDMNKAMIVLNEKFKKGEITR